MSANDVGKGFLQLCVTPRLMLLHHTLDIIIITVNVCVSEVQHEEGSRGGKYLGSLHCTEQHFSVARVWSILARAVS